MINPRTLTFVVACFSPFTGKLTQRIIEASSADRAIQGAMHDDGWTVDYSVSLESQRDTIEDIYTAINITK